ncbi:MAG: AarF/ABC1/UbiB kinase family protein, partial [Opitutaceae bacterium]|nr:AarF/ABC1/UbiB kinase family protein [Verrucomicrobiales bacterium]
MLSTWQDVLPEPFNLELVKLQDSAAPVPYEEIETVLRSEFKRPLAEIFQSIDPEPLGSASIAQVHRARLLTGEMVVVKVQRPGIRKIVTEDLEILRYIAGLLESHVEAVRIQNPTALVDEITKSLEKEIDFTIEAGHIERFAHQFEGDQTLHIPAVYREFTTTSVL